MAGRGPSYNEDEMKAIAKIGGREDLSLTEKADKFMEQFGGARSKTALIQKFRKLVQGPAESQEPKVAKPAKAAKAKNGKNGHSANGSTLNGETARLELSDGVVISGPAKRVAQIAAQI